MFFLAPFFLVYITERWSHQKIAARLKRKLFHVWQAISVWLSGKSWWYMPLCSVASCFNMFWSFSQQRREMPGETACSMLMAYLCLKEFLHYLITISDRHQKWFYWGTFAIMSLKFPLALMWNQWQFEYILVLHSSVWGCTRRFVQLQELVFTKKLLLFSCSFIG